MNRFRHDPGRRARVAVVGSGPAGIYAADHLVRQDGICAEVDIIDRLPAPYGLVRYGVAPDHPSIKSIANALRRVLEHPRIRFLGNLELGRELTIDNLLEFYAAVVIATGAPESASLGIPGSTMAGCFSATDVVGWYCGHPDARPLGALSASAAGVIGAGNVALDLARILSKSAVELAQTDIPEPALQVLDESRLRDVHIFCRRGPAQVKFTTKELRELGSLDDVDIMLDEGVLQAAGTQPLSRLAEANLQAFGELAQQRVDGRRRRLHFHFWSRPVEILGSDSVSAVRVERTTLDADGGLRGTGDLRDVPVGLVISAVGFRGSAIAGVPFDSRTGTVPHDRGRVTLPDGSPAAGLYVTGWAKRGPSGVVGTNRADAAETVRTLLADLPDLDVDSKPDHARPVSMCGSSDYDGWLRIDAAEISRGAAVGRPRIKIADWDNLYRLSRGASVKGSPER